MNKLDGQEMNVKKLCRKNISQIMEKTKVDFILVTSSIYHCYFVSGSASGDVRC